MRDWRSRVDLRMVRLRFQHLEPGVGPENLRFESGSNLTEPELHNSAKIFPISGG